MSTIQGTYKKLYQNLKKAALQLWIIYYQPPDWKRYNDPAKRYNDQIFNHQPS